MPLDEQIIKKTEIQKITNRYQDVNKNEVKFRGMKSFLGAIQYLAKFLPKLSEKTDRLRQLLKKNAPWIWGQEQENDFKQIKQMLTEKPCLAHYARDKDNMVTTDASKTGLGITLWQKQDDGELKPIAFGSRYLNISEYENNNQKMETLISERADITPLLGMDWMKRFKLTIGKIQLAEIGQSEKERINNKFPDLFENNRTIKDTEINIQLKPGHYPVKQKARPIPLHLQEDVGRELEKLIKAGHLEKVNNVDEDCFVSPVVITVKNDKSVKIALDSRKLNDSSIKPHRPLNH